jgi:two-component system OmpR family response regulator
MREPPPADLDRIYVLTDTGLQQLTGASTALPEAALRLLVLIDGKLSLARLVKHLHDLAEAEVKKITSTLVYEGHIAPVSAETAKKVDDLGTLDFFSQSSSLEASTDDEKKEQEFARSIQEAQNTSMRLKQLGFYVRIARRSAQKRNPVGGGGYSVLIAENDASFASVTRKILELEGFSPRIASNGAEIVTELRKSPPPDLMLLDAVLPDIDGFEVLTLVRKHPALQRLPVILLTAKATREDVMRGLVLGADGYITKPFEFDVLIRGIRAVLGLDAPRGSGKAD